MVGYVVLTAEAEGKELKEQINTWQQALLAVLPEYMVPDDFVLMTAIPITPMEK